MVTEINKAAKGVWQIARYINISPNPRPFAQLEESSLNPKRKKKGTAF